MYPKPLDIERKLIVSQDHRRKYGVRLNFQVLRPEYLNGLDSVTLLLPNGPIATLRSATSLSWEIGARFEMDVVGYPTAALAEEAGMLCAQALLLASITLDFGVRLNYHSHEPPTVFDRTVSPGFLMSAEGYSAWPPEVVVSELTDAFTHSLRNRRLLLSMELFAAASLESNDRARFVMAVSALEPLATNDDLGPEVRAFVDRTCVDLDTDTSIPDRVRQSLRGRVVQLSRESIRQSLFRLCETWFPGARQARESIEFAYSLRSQILHEGRLSDLDIELGKGNYSAQF